MLSLGGIPPCFSCGDTNDKMLGVCSHGIGIWPFCVKHHGCFEDQEHFESEGLYVAWELGGDPSGWDLTSSRERSRLLASLLMLSSMFLPFARSMTKPTVQFIRIGSTGETVWRLWVVSLAT